MLQITHHSIERYAERIMGMDEVSASTLTHAQYNMIRNMLTERFANLNITNAIVNYAEWDCRLVIVDGVLVTITLP